MGLTVWPGVPYELLHPADGCLWVKGHRPPTTRNKQEGEGYLRCLRNRLLGQLRPGLSCIVFLIIRVSVVSIAGEVPSRGIRSSPAGEVNSGIGRARGWAEG